MPFAWRGRTYFVLSGRLSMELIKRPWPRGRAGNPGVGKCPTASPGGGSDCAHRVQQCQVLDKSTAGDFPRSAARVGWPREIHPRLA